jgi:hypothetical protein
VERAGKADKRQSIQEGCSGPSKTIQWRGGADGGEGQPNERIWWARERTRGEKEEEEEEEEEREEKEEEEKEE